MWIELRLPEPASWSLKWNGTIHVMLIKEPSCWTKSRLSEKHAKVQKTCMHHTIWQHQKKANIYALQKSNDKCISQKNLLEVNPKVMNYNIRPNKNRPATRPVKHSLALLDHFFHYLWWQKNWQTRYGHVKLHASVAMEEGFLSVWVSQSIG